MELAVIGSVFVIYRADEYDCNSPEAVFSSRELAEKYVEKENPYLCQIAELEINKEIWRT